MNKAIALLLAFSVLTATGAIIVKAASSDDVTENYWETLASMPSAGGYEAAVVNGKIYVFGNSVNYEYDPAVDAWAVKTPMPTNRTSFGVAACEGKIYVIGKSVEETVVVNEVYDPGTDTWATKKSMPTNRTYMEANAVNGKIYLMGGYTDSTSGVTSNLNEVYDPATDSWTTMPLMPYHAIHVASVVLDKKIYLIGGQDNMGWNHNQIYDTETGTWNEGAPIPSPTWQAAAGATTGVWASKRIYVMGEEGGFADPLNQTFVYDPQTDTWSVGSSLPTALIDPAVAVVDELVYVMGGGVAPYTSTAAVERYTPFLLGTIPVVSVSSPENTTYTVTEVPLNFTVNEQVSWMGYSLDGQDNMTVTGNTTLTDLPEGTHSLVVYADDMVGDVGASEAIVFTVDVTSASITVLSPEAKAYDASDVPLVFVVDEPVSQIAYSLDGQDNVTVTGNTTLTGLSGGEHSVTVYAWDEAGNVGASETVTFTITKPEPFPTDQLFVAYAVAFVAVVVAVGVLVYLRKRNH